MNSLQAISFRLVAEILGANPKPLPLEVPPGCSFLTAGTLPSLSDTPPNGLALEPVLNRQRQPRLLLINSFPDRLQVNGEPAPRVTLLREGDRFQWDDGPPFHLTIYRRPQIGPAPADKVGKPCPICLTPFSSDPASITYSCSCGSVYHLDGPDKLECARAVQQCACGQAITLKEGYTSFPNLDS